jgi:type I restriction enzyme, R subunit
MSKSEIKKFFQETVKEIREGLPEGFRIDDKIHFDISVVTNSKAKGGLDSAVKILGDDVLRKITFELAEIMRKNDAVDWIHRESVQAKLRLKVKKRLRKYGYPPDMEKMATETVLKQAEQIGKSRSN